MGLVGSGTTVSLTPPLHVAEARALGLDYLYRAVDLDVLGLPAAEIGPLVRAAGALGFDGLNVTHPCKQLVLEHLDRLDPVAARLGAVNTVVFEAGTSVGHNTDRAGFAAAFARGLPGAARHRVVQLGAGGGGAAVADVLLDAGVEHLDLVDVNLDRAAGLAAALAARFPTARVDVADPRELPALLDGADGLVHCTPTGMAHHPGLPLDPAYLRASTWVADIVYRPVRTPLLEAARARGCRTLDGGLMAVHQAAETLRLVTGREPDVDRMRATFSALLAAEA